MMAASRLSLVQWRYRGELDHVSSTIRKEALIHSHCGHFVAALDQCVTPLLGKRTVNIDPLPGSLVTVTSPPIMRASLRVMARPRPVPPKRRAVAASAWLNSSNSFACCSAVMPMPVSTTASSIPLPQFPLGLILVLGTEAPTCL